MVDPQIFKGLLVFALLIAVYHFMYAHYLKGNSPPEMIGLLIVLAVVNYLALANKITIKRK